MKFGRWLASRREENTEIDRDLFLAGKLRREPQLCSLVLVGLAAGIELASDGAPVAAWQMEAIEHLGDDTLDIGFGRDIERARQLRDGDVDRAGAIRPCHEVIATEARLAHDFPAVYTMRRVRRLR